MLHTDIAFLEAYLSLSQHLAIHKSTTLAINFSISSLEELGRKREVRCMPTDLVVLLGHNIFSNTSGHILAFAVGDLCPPFRSFFHVTAIFIHLSFQRIRRNISVHRLHLLSEPEVWHGQVDPSRIVRHQPRLNGPYHCIIHQHKTESACKPLCHVPPHLNTKPAVFSAHSKFALRSASHVFCTCSMHGE